MPGRELLTGKSPLNTRTQSPKACRELPLANTSQQAKAHRTGKNARLIIAKAPSGKIQSSTLKKE
jgi:hypothetical protein